MRVPTPKKLIIGKRVLYCGTMNVEGFTKYKPYIIIGILVFLAVIALWLRMLPAAGLVTEEGVNLLGNEIGRASCRERV